MKKAHLFSAVSFLMLIFLVLGCGRQQTDELAITTSSDEARELFYEGLQKFDYFYMDEARALFGQAVELDPEFAIAHYYWALSTGSSDESLEKIKRAADLTDKVTEPERLIILSRMALIEDSTGKARNMLEKLVELKPESKRAHYLLGNFYYQQREWELAETHLKRAIELDSRFAAPFNMLGYLYSNTGRYPEAIEALKKYSELRPEEPNPHDSMGEIFLAMGDYENSIRQYKKALKLESDFIYSIIGIGHNYVFMGDYDKARETYDKVYQVARNFEDSSMAGAWKVVSYIHEEKYDRALEMLQAGLEKAREAANIYSQANIYLQMSRLHYMQGNVEKALALLDDVRRIASRPDIQQMVKENLIRETLAFEAIILTRLGRRDEANQRLADYKKSAVDSKSRLIMLHFRGVEGMVAFWNKDYETAISKLSSADPLNPMVKFYLGLALLKTGETDQAREVFTELVGFNRNSFSYAMVRPKAMDMIAKIT